MDDGVTVRLFAALREAAGTTETTGPSGSVADLLACLADRYGEVFRRRLQVATVLVDGEVVHDPAGTEVLPGAEVVLLPPVSGGALSTRLGR